MAYKMSKRGSLDNEITNEFFCDTETDLNNIPKDLVNLGSVAVVIDGMGIYIANSKKEWVSFIGNSSDDNDGSSPEVDQGQADSMVLGE